MPRTKVMCPECSFRVKMRVAYARVNNTWKRVGFWCPRCGHLEEPGFYKFRPGRKGLLFF